MDNLLNMKNVIRLCEADFKRIIKESVRRTLREMYDTSRYDAEIDFQDNYDWGGDEEEYYDGDPDDYRSDVNPTNDDPSDGDLYGGVL